MKNKSLIIIAVTLGILVLASVTFFACSGNKHVQFTTSFAGQGTVETVVMATGYVQPVEKVDVGTQVSGVIEKIYVDFNSFVKKGELLAELDKLTLNEKLVQSNASYASAQSDLTYAQQNFDRTNQLYQAKAATQVALEEATNRLDQAKTSLANARANVQQARTNLGYANIYSPIDGVVLDRTVSVGQTVAASFNTPTLFTIAEDLTKMQVEADVDEADIGHVKVGQKVTFTVDAFNEDTFEGTVNQVRLQPTVTNNVVTYTVIIEAPNPDEKLFPGMTASINIIAESESGVTIPVSALNFKVSDDVGKHLGLTEQAVGSQTRDQSHHEVWVRHGNTLELKQVQTGVNDGVNVVVTSGLTDGDEVVLAAVLDKKKSNNNQAAANPLMPQRRGGGGGGPR